jgi:hypothetical protein
VFRALEDEKALRGGMRSERASDAELNEAHVLARQFIVVREGIGPLQEWVSSSYKFFSEANLRAVLYATKTEAQATVQNRGLVVIVDGTRKRISASRVEEV